MNYKTSICALAFISSVSFGMHNEEKMLQLKTMEDAARYTGKMLASKPRTKLGENLVTSNWEQVNFSLINPNIDTFWHRETKKEEQYYYFHVLNKFGNAILTRVISQKTLNEEPLSFRLATPEEKEHITACLEGRLGGIYTMEFSGRPEYKEACFTCKRLNPAHIAIKKALEKEENGLGIKRYEQEELP